MIEYNYIHIYVTTFVSKCTIHREFSTAQTGVSAEFNPYFPY